jgi:hypothetical protein
MADETSEVDAQNLGSLLKGVGNTDTDTKILHK